MYPFWRIVRRLPLPLLLALTATPANAQLYRIDNLGTLGGNFSAATTINSLGQVAGTSTTASGRQHAFLWTNGTLQDLPPLPGDTDSSAIGLNDQGKVVGLSWRGPSSDTFNGVLWAPGYTRKLTAAGGTSVSVTDINNTGVITGAVKRGDQWQAILWTPEGVRELPGVVTAIAVNERDDVAGSATAVHGTIGHRIRFGWLWRAGVVVELGREGANPNLPPSEWDVVDLNARGQVALYRRADDVADPTALRWTDGVYQSLGHLGLNWTIPGGMNDAGDVVGASLIPAGVPRAVLYRDGAGLLDLNTKLPAGSGWILQGAAAINNRGQIAGGGQHNGQPRAFLLTPLWTRPGILKP